MQSERIKPVPVKVSRRVEIQVKVNFTPQNFQRVHDTNELQNNSKFLHMIENIH
jgi:hypothetical protein